MPDDGRNKIGKAARDGEDEYIYGIEDERQRSRNKIPKLRVEQFAYYRKKLSRGEWIYPPKNDKNDMIEEYYPIDSQWLSGYAFDITSGDTHQEKKSGVKYWQRILPETDRGKGDLPLMGFAKPTDIPGTKQTQRYLRPITLKESDDYCPGCGNKSELIIVDNVMKCLDCEGEVELEVVLDMSPEATMMTRTGVTSDTLEARLMSAKTNLKPNQTHISRAQKAEYSDVKDRRKRLVFFHKEISKRVGPYLDDNLVQKVYYEVNEEIFDVVFTDRQLEEYYGKKNSLEWDKITEEVKMNPKPREFNPESESNSYFETMSVEEQAKMVQLRKTGDEKFVWNAGPMMGRDLASSVCMGLVDYRKHWMRERPRDVVCPKTGCGSKVNDECTEGGNDVKLHKERVEACQVWVNIDPAANEDDVAVKILEWANKRREEPELPYRFKDYRWDWELELSVGILVCATASDVEGDSVTIDNAILMAIHKAMLEEPNVTYIDKSTGGRMSEKALGNKKGSVTWNYMSIVAVVIFVRRYYWFFKRKKVVWEN
ncbi:MAG: hypothetical protein QF440_01795 [Candidatus Thalassarchaeaceae archaeon]|jgi:hypothetical protein|nr:hypothetical protein [Candidatus Thalassarchaeaceae archaeon]